MKFDLLVARLILRGLLPLVQDSAERTLKKSSLLFQGFAEMSIKQASAWLELTSSNMMKEHGFFFLKKGGDLIRLDSDGWQGIRFQAIKSSVPNIYSLGVGIAISHREVRGIFEAALIRKGLLGKDPFSVVPLGVNGLYLCPHKDPAELYFPSTDNAQFTVRLKGWMTNHILPLVTEFLIPERYMDKIEQTEPRD